MIQKIRERMALELNALTTIPVYQFDFVTALTAEECDQRLAQAALRTVEQQLSVRTDGTRFAVDMPGQNYKKGYAALTSTIHLDGSLESTTDNGTRVHGRITDSVYRERAFGLVSDTPLLIIFGLVSLGLAVVEKSIWSIFFLAGAIVLLWSALSIHKGINAASWRLEENLFFYVREWLYVDPSPKQ